jgi:hypothetical protein
MHFLRCLPDWELDTSLSIHFCGQHVPVQHTGLVVSLVLDFSFFQTSPTHSPIRTPDFVDLIVLDLVEDIETPKDRDETILELKAFASVRALLLRPFFQFSEFFFSLEGK